MTETAETSQDAGDLLATMLAPRTAETEDVQLDGLGISVTVRGLTRAEANRVIGKPMEAAEQERILLAAAMVNPRMSQDQVRQWQKVAPAGEIEKAAAAVRRLSGLGAEAVKEDMARFQD